MIAALYAFLALLAVPTHEQDSQGNSLISPCPNVFIYESPGTEPGRWNGVVKMSTDSTLPSVWLNILLDSKADLVGNWLGQITTQDNMEFRIEDAGMKITPGPVAGVRFHVKYDTRTEPPRLQAVRLNGREICNVNPQPQPDIGQELPKLCTNVKLPDTSSFTTTSKRPHTEIRPVDIPLTRPVRKSSTVRPVNSPNPSSISGDVEFVAGGQPIVIKPASSPSSNPVNNYNSNNRYGQDIGGVNLYNGQQGSVLVFSSNTQ